MSHVFDQQDQPVPWARGGHDPHEQTEMPCPFCGGSSVLISFYDQRDDARRIEL